MLNLQPASKRELKRISIGVIAGSALMLVVLAVLRRFTLPALWGALLGAAVAIGNFLYLALSVQKAAAAEEKQAKRIMRSSYTLRMLITIAAVLLGLKLDIFYWLAVLIPILMPRVTILMLQITGAYRPDKGTPAKTMEKEE